MLNLFNFIRGFVFIAMVLFISGQAQAESLEYCLKGQKTLNSGNASEAIGLYTRCINEGDLSKRFLEIAYKERGVARRRNNQADEAISDFNEALKLNPKDADVYNERGMAQAMKNDFDGAIKDLSAALKFNPRLANAIINRGLVYEALGRTKEAVQDFTMASNQGARGAQLEEKLKKYGIKTTPRKKYNVVMAMPEDFKLVFKNAYKNSQIYQYVPIDETAKDWRQMITIVISKLNKPTANIAEIILAKTLKGYQGKCGASKIFLFDLPKTSRPFVTGALVCNDVDLSQMPTNFIVRKNSFIIDKVYATPEAVYSFQYEWQDDEKSAPYLLASGFFKEKIMPVMKKMEVKAAN